MNNKNIISSNISFWSRFEINHIYVWHIVMPPKVHLIVTLVYLFTIVGVDCSENLLQEIVIKNAHSDDYNDFKYDNLPSINHQFKFEVIFVKLTLVRFSKYLVRFNIISNMFPM